LASGDIRAAERQFARPRSRRGQPSRHLGRDARDWARFKRDQLTCATNDYLEGCQPDPEEQQLRRLIVEEMGQIALDESLGRVPIVGDAWDVYQAFKEFGSGEPYGLTLGLLSLASATSVLDWVAKPIKSAIRLKRIAAIKQRLAQLNRRRRPVRVGDLPIAKYLKPIQAIVDKTGIPLLCVGSMVNPEAKPRYPKPRQVKSYAKTQGMDPAKLSYDDKTGPSDIDYVLVYRELEELTLAWSDCHVDIRKLPRLDKKWSVHPVS
jgi:hypothetical protein